MLRYDRSPLGFDLWKIKGFDLFVGPLSTIPENFIKKKKDANCLGRGDKSKSTAAITKIAFRCVITSFQKHFFFHKHWIVFKCQLMQRFGRGELGK